MKRMFFAVCAIIMTASMIGCESESKNARIQIWLTDAPGDYDEVNVEILGVEVHADGGDQNSGWQGLAIEDGVYDLLELTNGLDTLLGTIELPAGRISQVRLKLGNDNSIKVGDDVHDLVTPSGQQSGLKIQVHKVLQEGLTYKILLDFDVARSIVLQGNGTYSLKPVIRAITEAQDGAIKGSVSPAESTPAIYAILGTDTIATTFSDESGKFLIRGLAAGSYTVGFAPNSNYEPFAKENVSVSIGSVTDMGVVTIAD
jgi:hypothetical protein